jgi:hypothetical protein
MIRGDEDDHYHTVANPAKGEKAGERGLLNRGYRPEERARGVRTRSRRRRNRTATQLCGRYSRVCFVCLICSGRLWPWTKQNRRCE